MFEEFNNVSWCTPKLEEISDKIELMLNHSQRSIKELILFSNVVKI